jgi:hypothetical protein
MDNISDKLIQILNEEITPFSINDHSSYQPLIEKIDDTVFHI